MKSERILGAISVLLALTAGMTIPAARAADPTPAREEPGAGIWKFQITGYGWAAGVNGKSGVAGLPPSDINLPFSKILSHLDGALMSAFYATNGTWSVLGDIMWARLSAKTNLNDLPRTFVEVGQRQLTASAVVGYRLPVGGPELELSATAGMRYNRLTLDLSVQPGFLPLAFDRRWVKAWADPIVGVAARYRLNNDWFLTGIADVGGFGVGSRLTAQGVAAVGYNWNANWSSSIGYRVLYTDYRAGGFSYRVTQHGPFTTLSYKF